MKLSGSSRRTVSSRPLLPAGSSPREGKKVPEDVGRLFRYDRIALWRSLLGPEADP